MSSQGTADTNTWGPAPGTPDSIAYSWNWGDGTALSTGASPSHTYAAAGAYTITLTTTDGWGKAGSTTRNVSLSEPASNQAPTADFTWSCPTYTTCQFNSAPGTADPDGDTIRYSWNFGDTGTSTSAAPSRTYVAPGTYTVVLTATDVWGKVGTATKTVTITEPAGNTGPTATFTATCTTLTCAMNSTGTVDPEGHTIKGYSWNWGDNTALSTGASPSHTYATPGTYTITLTATDSWNRAGTPVTREVTMTEPAGNAGPTAVMPVPTCTATNTTCAFTSTGSADPEGNTPLRYLWNWGDGTAVSTTASGSHVFPVAGTYTVTLTVTDAWGRAGAPVTRQVTTSSEPAGNTGPTIAFPQPACTGLSCAVTSTGTADPEGIRSYSWSWGDGTAPSTGASPSAHVYAAAGTYTITVTVLDNWGRPSVATRQVTVA
jgi:PKD repeat protein